jgi:hypothetical protein
LVPALSRAIDTIAAIVTSTASSIEQPQGHALDRNADQLGGVGIAAHREHITPEAGSMHEERQLRRDAGPDQHRNRNSLRLGLRRDLVAVHGPRKREQHDARQHRDRDVDPQRLVLHFMAAAGATPLRHPNEQSRGDERGQRPSRRDADAAVVPAAQTLEESSLTGCVLPSANEKRGRRETTSARRA